MKYSPLAGVALVLLAAGLLAAPIAFAQIERPGVPQPVDEPNATFTFHGEIEFEAEVRPAGAPPHSHAMLTETLEIGGVKSKEGWGDFVSAFTDAITRAWLNAIPAAASGEKGKVIVTFALRRDGSLDGALSLAHSSGDASMDAATRIAIAKAAPFAPLPQKFAKPVAQLRVTFAYDHPRAPTPQPGGSQ